MLVLRRVSGQQIIMTGDIRITVLKVIGQQVKLGIEAPREVVILRGELTPFEEDQRNLSPPDVPPFPSEEKKSFPS
jgi:carbon storage regulator